MTEERLQSRIERFSRALASLEVVVARDNDEENILRDSTIQRFEFTLEMGWKLLLGMLQWESVLLKFPTPRVVIKKAYACGMIIDGDAWIKALADRNDMSHTYCGDDSEIIYQRIKDRYVWSFRQLKESADAKFRSIWLD